MTENKDKRQLKTEPRLRIKLTEEQKEVARLFHEFDVNFIIGDFGCFALGTKVRMADGSVKSVEDIVVGDSVMGVDSKPRKVLSLNRGKDKMYKVSQKKGGVSYTVNSEHELVLSKYYKPTYKRETKDGKRVTNYSVQITPSRREDNQIIKVKDFLKIPFNNINYQGYISDAIDYPEKSLPIDPYYLGLWLGDGDRRDIKHITNVDEEILKYLSSIGTLRPRKHDDISYVFLDEDVNLNEPFKKLYGLTNCTKLESKYIPKEYLLNSVDNRLKLLAGLIDSDGSLKQFNYEITQKNKQLSLDIYELVRSLGFNAFFRDRTSKLKREDGSTYSCKTYRISFSPNMTIPCKVKRKQVKGQRVDGRDQKYSGLKITEVGIDNYYGFKIDGDNLFLLEDYTVVHNCGKTLTAVYIAINEFRKKNYNKVWITRPMLKTKLAALPGSIEEKLAPYVFPIMQNINECQAEASTEKMIKEGVLKIMPIEVAKGVTFMDSCVIVDEFQDMDYQDFRTILTRLGKDSKIIFCGSPQQVDKTMERTSCLKEVMKLKDSGIVGFTELKANHRNPVLSKIIDYLEGKQ